MVLLVCLACNGVGQAQEAPPSATLLEDRWHYWLDANANYHATHTARIRVNDARALKGARIQDFAFNARFERLTLAQAYVRHSNGRRRWVPTKDVSFQPLWQAGAEVEYRDAHALRVVFTDLRVGDEIVVVTRCISDPRRSFPKQFTVLVGPHAPVIDKATALTIDAPATLPLHALHVGFLAAAPVTTHGRTRYRWTGDGSVNPAPEPDAGNEASFRPGLEVTSFADPAALARAHAPAYRARSRPTPAVAALAAALVQGVNDAREKALLIHRWVQDHIRYKAILFGREMWLPLHSAAQVLQRRAGDCKDHVVLMGALLAAVGIESTPAKISWGLDLFTVPAVVHEGTFNHVITFVPSLNLYLDATNTDNDGNYLASNQLDKVTLLVNTGELGRTPSHQLTKRAFEYVVTIADDRTARFSYAVRAEGDDAGLLRRQFGRFANNAAIGWGNALLKNHGWRGQSIDRFDDTHDISDHFTYRFEGNIDQFLAPTPAPDFAAVSSLSDDIGRIARILSKDQARTQPRVCDGLHFHEHATYAWPAGFDIEVMPQDLDINNPIVRYAAKYRRDGNTLSIDRSLQSGKADTALCSAAEAMEMAAAMLAIKHDTESRIRLNPVASSYASRSR